MSQTTESSLARLGGTWEHVVCTCARQNTSLTFNAYVVEREKSRPDVYLEGKENIASGRGVLPCVAEVLHVTASIMPRVHVSRCCDGLPQNLSADIPKSERHMGRLPETFGIVDWLPMTTCVLRTAAVYPVYLNQSIFLRESRVVTMIASDFTTPAQWSQSI